MSAQFVFQYQPKSRLYYDDKSYQEAITKEQVCEAASQGNSDLKSDKKVDDDDDDDEDDNSITFFTFTKQNKMLT